MQRRQQSLTATSARCGITHKSPYWLELVNTDALLQAGQAVEPDKDRQGPDILGLKLASQEIFPRSDVRRGMCQK